MPPAPTQKRLVLASGSPRRRELLARMGLSFDVVTADLDESVRAGEAPRDYVQRLAREKAEAVARKHPDAVVIGADTSVILGERILGKPAGAAEAAQMLRELSGRAHAVLTGVAIAGVRAIVVETAVHFRALKPNEIDWYARSGEPLDKAGGYALQGLAGAFVTRIEGSSSNVIGLPLAETLALLEEAGVALPWS